MPSGERRRLARAIIKWHIRNAGGKVSHFAAKEIGEAADELLKITKLGASRLEKELKRLGSPRA